MFLQCITNSFEKVFKRHLSIEFKENLLNYFSLRESLPKPKSVIPNLDFHQCFCSKRLIYPKSDLKGNYYMFCLKKIIQVDFSMHTLPKPKVGLPNLAFTKFFCGK